MRLFLQITLVGLLAAAVLAGAAGCRIGYGPPDRYRGRHHRDWDDDWDNDHHEGGWDQHDAPPRRRRGHRPRRDDPPRGRHHDRHDGADLDIDL